MESWTDFAVVKSEAVRMETDLYRREGGDELTALKELFEVTKDTEDVVSSNAVAEAVAQARLNMSRQKVRKSLELVFCIQWLTASACEGLLG